VSRTITSPSKIWTGTVTLCDALLLPQAEAIDEAMLGEPLATNGKVTYTAIDKIHLPAVFACVEKWNLAGFPQTPTLENFPMNPLPARHELVEWLWNEVRLIYFGEAEVPNE
jgi:hypothetical protein